ncbi:MAG: hypothetical protein K2X03_11360 [Bryobacteraceae bacterium]|nr:hypothetical protein [Bryobacteraceae bacterium]
MPDALSTLLGADISLVHWWLSGSMSSLAFSQPLVTFLLMVALALIGDGAISLDSRLFGRREIVIPVSKRDE